MNRLVVLAGTSAGSVIAIGTEAVGVEDAVTFDKIFGYETRTNAATAITTTVRIAIVATFVMRVIKKY